jgi:DNA polymerase-1
MPIQWTNADIIKISMIQIYDFLQTPLQTSPLTGERLKNWYLLKSKLIMQVHDELVFDVFPWEENIIKETIPNIMENIVKNENIQLKVDTGIGTNWKEAK